MLTNKKILVLMILLSLFSVSCSNNNIEKENEKDTIEYID
jgi:PBP1b-binding outer membrane lipoprotein LpoB